MHQASCHGYIHLWQDGCRCSWWQQFNHLLAQGLQICEITHNCTICEYSMIPQNVGLAFNFADASHALKILQSQS